MPNGHQEDTRPLWQRVKDMQKELRDERENVRGLKIRLENLEKDKNALLDSLRLLRKEGE